jgi:hypothetical protein
MSLTPPAQLSPDRVQSIEDEAHTGYQKQDDGYQLDDKDLDLGNRGQMR